MSGYTVRTPVAVLTTLAQDFQQAGSFTLQDLRDVWASVASIVPNVQTTSYTLALTDVWQGLVMNSPTAVTVTVPPNASVPFQIGSIIPWYGLGAGLITFVGGAGVTLETRVGGTLVSAVQRSSGGLWMRAVDTWVVSGDLT
jgi:hypothetical protein